MININDINEVQSSVGGQPRKKPLSGESTDAFDTVLNSALEKSRKTEPGAQTAGLEEIAAPGFNLEPLSSVVTGKTDKLLGMLENYAEQLDKPEVSLKQMEPVLQEINAKANALLEKTKFLGEEDRGLAAIATQTVMAARTEYVKFQRGDYIA